MRSENLPQEFFLYHCYTMTTNFFSAIIYKDNRGQGHMDTKTQGHKDTGTQEGHKDRRERLPTDISGGLKGN